MKTDKKIGIFEKIKSGKSLEIIVVAILAVIIMIVIYNATYKKSEKTQTTLDYYSSIEEKLIYVLSEIDGAGDVKVMITFADEGEKVLAYETVENTDGSIVTKPVIVNGNVVIISEKSPEISGVLIVATGANNISVRSNLVNAAAAVLNINQSVIKVYEG